MKIARDYIVLTQLHIRMSRDEIVILSLVQLVYSVGFVLGFGYVIPTFAEETALYVTTGAATLALISVGLVAVPQFLAFAKGCGQMDYFLALPISREAYLLAILTQMALIAIPGILGGLIVGWLVYSLDLTPHWQLALVMPLSMLALGGPGVAIAVFVPRQRLADLLTLLLTRYITFLAPLMMPAAYLPTPLRAVGALLPSTYAADALRASLTNVPDRQLADPLAAMMGFALLSLGASSLALRHRG